MTEDGLLVSTSLFLERLKKEKRIRPSPKEQLYFDTLIGMGVRKGFLWDMTLEHWLAEKPWDFRAKVLREWDQLKKLANRLRVYFVGHRGERPTQDEIARVKMYAGPNLQAWAFGQDTGGDPQGQSVGEQ